MNKTSAQKEKNSLRTFFLFCSIVFLLIIGSLGIKLFTSIKDSIYTPQHNFIVGIKAKDSYSLSSIDPKNRTISTITILTDGKEIQPGKTVGIIPDTEVAVTHNTSSHFRDVLPSFFLNNRHLTWFDVTRMYLLTNGFEEKRQSIKLSDLNTTDFSPEVTFNDPEIVDEQVTIGIINATGQVGVGASLEKVLVTLGGTVISVTTAQQPRDHSSIQSTSLDSYTAHRASSLLHIPLTKAPEGGISDIMIVLGKDILRGDKF